MKRAYFEDGTIIECQNRACLKRNVKHICKRNKISNVFFSESDSWRRACLTYDIKMGYLPF